MTSLRERERSPFICGSFCLFRDLECCLGAVTRVRTYPQRDTRGLGGELVLIVPESESCGSERERHFLGVTGSERNALETAQCFDRHRDASSSQPQVKLDGFLSRSCSRVRNLGVDAQRCAGGSLALLKLLIQCLRTQLRLLDLEVPVAIARIGQPVAEWELRAVLLVDVTRDEFLVSILRGTR